MKTIWPVKMGDEALVWLFVWIGGDCLHMVQLMPLPSRNPVISCIIFSDWFDLSGIGLPRLSWKRGR